MSSDYPVMVIEIIDDSMRFKPATLKALRRFADSRPWRGRLTERKQKFRKLHQALSTAYGISEPQLVFGSIDGSSSGESHYIQPMHRIVLVGRLSVVTFLHEFAHARGLGERDACRWSVNLFRRVFPGQYARLVHVGHTLVSPTEAAESVRGS